MANYHLPQIEAVTEIASSEYIWYMFLQFALPWGASPMHPLFRELEP